VFGYITDGDGAHLQGAIDIALSRFAEYHNLEGAFGRRAVIERAKGILMERHGANDNAAFEMLRDHSQHTGRKLFDIAQAVLDSHQLLSPTQVETPTGGWVRRRITPAGTSAQ
jgi:AmiR/NasT family two-component response regulator